MLFNSYAFIFIFLPVVLGGYLLLVRRSPAGTILWLALASLIFYAGWNPRYVPLLLISVAMNFGFAQVMHKRGASKARLIMAVSVAANLALLAYFKYANFLLANVDALSGLDYSFGTIILPLGISFFTFTQIAFLVDVAVGQTSEPSFQKYLLFVSFFPHLIAGPIVHHASIVPQFDWRDDKRAEDLAVGSAIFVVGLCKKVVLADTVAQFATPVFDSAAQGHALGLVESWAGVVAFSLQLYFDFSGYSDMAIGLARMFGIKFPLNFNSPYKSASIIEFWRRWHMTLSRFLRDYLYFPLGGNRRGLPRRYFNLMVTMMLGGLWHGAAWTFVVWGALHGAYLLVNHAWRALRQKFGIKTRESAISSAAGITLTFAVVTVAWVFFRAPSLAAALNLLAGMSGLHGLRLPYQWLAHFGAFGTYLAGSGISFVDMGPTFAGARQIVLTAILLGIVWFLPNTQEIIARFSPALDAQPASVLKWWQWRPTPAWALVLAALTMWPLLLLNRSSEFLYYQF